MLAFGRTKLNPIQRRLIAQRYTAGETVEFEK